MNNVDPILYWNDVANEANRVAHSRRLEDPQDSVSLGPAGSSRTYAIVHLAMHDAYFGINTGHYDTYLDDLPPSPHGADTNAAVAAAAHATLSALYPTQKPFFDTRHAGVGLSGKGLSEGHAFGLAVARAILDRRKNDPDLDDDGYAGSVAQGHHRHDPRAEQGRQSYYATFYGAASNCFAVTERFRLDKPPELDSQEYRRALREVRAKGIAPELMGTLPSGSDPRTPSETLTGLFWAYDGARNLGTPPRLYNQIVRQVAMQQHKGVANNARLFALVNTAMADAAILAWDEKYYHDLWRPVLGVREHDPSTGPTATGGNNLDPDADPEWYPLGAPATNRPGAKNLTPNFPAYPSGHATFGAAAFQTVRRHYLKDCDNGPDNLANGLEFVSDELNGINQDNQGAVRTRHARIFEDGLWEMIEDNGRSRIFLGVHWGFDAFAVTRDGAVDLGRNVGGVPLGLKIANNIAAEGLKASAAAGPRNGSGLGGGGKVYVLSNQATGNSVTVFDRASDGRLTRKGTFPTGGLGAGGANNPLDPLTSQGSLAFSDDHRFLFAVDAGSNEVSVLAIDREKLMPVDRVASGGTFPVSVTIRHNLVYVLHRGDPNVGDANVSGFTVEPDGRLSPLLGSTQMLVGGREDFPAQVGFTPDGTHLVVTERGNNLIDLLPIDDDGRAGQPVKNDSSGSGPFGFTFAGHDILIVSEANANAASSYRLGQDGRLTVISGSVPTTEQAACWVVTNSVADPRYAYVSNTGSGSISGYRVDSAGALSLLTASGQTGVTEDFRAVIDSAVSGDGKFLYVVTGGFSATAEAPVTCNEMSISAFRIEADGNLTPIHDDQEFAPVVQGLAPGTQGIAAI